MLVQLAVHIFVLVALKLFLNSLLYNFLIIILKFSIIKKAYVVIVDPAFDIMLSAYCPLFVRANSN